MSSSAAHFSIEAVVIGAGVLGLACARALAMRGIEVLIVERNDSIGSGTLQLGNARAKAMHSYLMNLVDMKLWLHRVKSLPSSSQLRSFTYLASLFLLLHFF